MNKYHEVLDELRSLVHSELDGTRMLNEYLEYCNTLQELVDKATPKKIIRTPYKDIYGNELLESKSHFYNGCPSCKDNVGIDAQYCRHCGQRLER